MSSDGVMLDAAAHAAHPPVRRAGVEGAVLGPPMAELVGKAAGVCKDEGGSLHRTDFTIGSLGGSGITGASIPIAAGAAPSARLFGDGRVGCASVIGEDVEADVGGTTGGSKSRAGKGDFVQGVRRHRVRSTPLSEGAIVGASIGTNPAMGR